MDAQWNLAATLFRSQPALMYSLILGHATIAIAYLLIAYVLRNFAWYTEQAARSVSRLFTLFSWFMFFCGVQHLIAVATWWIPLQWFWLYAISMWLTALAAFEALGFIWRLRPQYQMHGTRSLER